MANYVKLAATAQRLIEKNGRTVTLRRLSETAADPNKPWRGNTASNTDLTPKAVVLDYDLTEITSSDVARGDKRAFVAQNSVGSADLTEYDELIDGDETWSIERVTTLNPGDVVLFYDLQLRR